MNDNIIICNNSVFYKMTAEQLLLCNKNNLDFNYIGVTWNNIPEHGFYELAKCVDGKIINKNKCKNNEMYFNDIRITKMNLLYCVGFRLYGNYEIKNILLIPDGSYEYSVEKYFELECGIVTIISGTVDKINYGQQLDSSEPASPARCYLALGRKE